MAMARKKLFLVLVVIVVIFTFEIYYYDMEVLHMKPSAVNEEEGKYVGGANDLCGISFAAKSWTSGMLTRYQPEISAREAIWTLA